MFTFFVYILGHLSTLSPGYMGPGYGTGRKELCGSMLLFAPGANTVLTLVGLRIDDGNQNRDIDATTFGGYYFLGPTGRGGLASVSNAMTSAEIVDLR
jgi:hypothetical protein